MAKIRRASGAQEYDRRPSAGRTAAQPRRISTQAARRRRTRRRKGILVTLALLAASVFFVFQLWRTGMVPEVGLALAGVVLALCWLLTIRAQKYPRRGAFMRFTGWVLTAALAVGCVYTQQGLTVLQTVTIGGVSGAEAQQIRREPFLVYLSGVDSRGDLNEKSRSDVNIIAAVNPVTKQVVLVNTPRDYYVPLAGHDGAMDKLTHAGLYGVDCSMQTLGGLYGVQIPYYLKMDFEGFIGIIDALGGIDVTVDEGFTTVGSPNYYDPVTLQPGVNHLNGAQALAFARERHAFANGDVQRGINQMKVIQAAMEKAKSPAVLVGYSGIMSSVADSFVTNLSSDQIRALVKMQLAEGGDWQVSSFTVTGTGGTSTSCYSAKGSSLYVMQPDEASVAQAQQMLAAALALPQAGASSAAAAAA